MSKTGMHKSGGTKARGRTAGAASAASKKSPTRPNHPIQMNVDVDRPIGSGIKRRGDRRDTNKQFTNSNSRQPNMGDPLGSGKKQKQGGGKALKQPSRRRV